jgi:hypothetical protein
MKFSFSKKKIENYIVFAFPGKGLDVNVEKQR